MTTVHDYGPGQRQRGVDYSIYNFEYLTEGPRFYMAGFAQVGDAVIAEGDQIIVTLPGSPRGRLCMVEKASCRGPAWDISLTLVQSQ